MSVGWLKVRRTDYETFEKQKIMPHALSLFWDISSDPADSGMLILSQKTITLQEDPIELQSWTGSWKMKQQTHPPPLPSPSQIMDDTARKPKCTILPSLFEGKEV